MKFPRARERQLIAERDEWQRLAVEGAVLLEQQRALIRDLLRQEKAWEATLAQMREELTNGVDPSDPR